MPRFAHRWFTLFLPLVELLAYEWSSSPRTGFASKPDGKLGVCCAGRHHCFCVGITSLLRVGTFIHLRLRGTAHHSETSFPPIHDAVMATCFHLGWRRWPGLCLGVYQFSWSGAKRSSLSMFYVLAVYPLILSVAYAIRALPPGRSFGGGLLETTEAALQRCNDGQQTLIHKAEQGLQPNYLVLLLRTVLICAHCFLNVFTISQRQLSITHLLSLCTGSVSHERGGNMTAGSKR